MPNKPIDPATLSALLKPKEKTAQPKSKPPQRRFLAPPQQGPLRYVEQGNICVVAGYYKYSDDGESKEWVKTNGCKTPSNYTVLGIPMCATHALRALNELLIDGGIDLTEHIIEDIPEAERQQYLDVQARLIRAADSLLQRLKQYEPDVNETAA